MSGGGLPNLTSGEAEKWGQKDIPVEATAIFPPDSPQGWPASNYTRGTIYYRDSTSRTVNVASPGGAIATSEYNEQNDVTRSLSADNRVTALNETKPAEAAKLLDTQSEYNSEGTELLSTLGPRHYVKLANGKKVQARSHTLYSYDEGAPSEGGPYRLVTKMTQGAQIEGEPEQDIRTTVTSYSGQNGLGWRLRVPTSVTTDPNGRKLTHTTIYDETTGNAIESLQPGVASAPVVLSTSVKPWTTTSKEWFNPYGATVDAKGNVWVVEPKHNELQEFSSTGQSLAKIGSAGTGNGQFKEPQDVAIDKEGNLWITDMGNNRIQEFSATGAFIQAFGSQGAGNGYFNQPQGIAIDSLGNIWVGDAGNNRVQEFTATGAFVNAFGGEGTGNRQFKTEVSGSAQGMWIAIDSERHLWVSDPLNDRVQELGYEGAYITQFGTKGTGNGQFENPQGVAVDSKGNIWVVDSGNGRIEQFSHEGAYLAEVGSRGTSNGQFKSPHGIAIGSTGHLWIADTENHRLQQIAENREYVSQVTAEGTVEEKVSIGAPVTVGTKGNVWITDPEHDRVEKFNEKGEFISQFGSAGTGNGQFESPGWLATDAKGDVWVVDRGNDRVQEFNEKGEYISQFGSAGTGEGQFKEPQAIAIEPNGNMWIVDGGNDRVQEFNKNHEYITQFGSEGTGNGQLKQPVGIAVGGASSSVWVVDSHNNRVERFNEYGEYVSQFGTEGTSNGQFDKPNGIAIDARGDIWVADSVNSRIQRFTESGGYVAQFGAANTRPVGIALDPDSDLWVSTNTLEKWINKPGVATRTVYYTAAPNASYPACGEHREWANMTCETLPATQPETPGVPNLPVSTVTYNMYGEPVKTTSTVGANTRTNTITYDEAGRTLSDETSSTVGKPLPAVTNKYSETTGALTEQSTTSEGSTRSLKSTYNTLGQLTAYTDASSNTTTYEYEPTADMRLTHVDDGKGTQEYTYDPTTGSLTKLVDTQGTNQLIFTATYDIEGNMTSQTYPDGLKANYTHSPTGETTELSYFKTTNCSENCTWFSDSVVPSIHGQWLSQQSTLASDTYNYDQAGRLTQTQETPAGEGCTTRIYSYDEETNRTSLTSRPPGTGGACSNEGGTMEAHTYDNANRLTDVGAAYEPFGQTSKLPAGDAGGSELQSTFYTDGQLHEQSQNGQSIGYTLDPAGRTQETIDTGTVNSTYVSHYAGEEDSPSWTIEPTSGHWTRYVSAIGGLGAIETDTGEPVLQIQDLQGNVVATASSSETTTKLLSTERHTEYGVPTSTKPAKYGWLGGDLTPTELPSGVVAMGARSYIPQLGRFLQTDPVPGGSANAYAYVFGDPVNTSDPSGADANGPSAWAIGLASEFTGQEVAAYEQAKREEAERKAAEAAAAAAAYAALEAATAPPTEGGVEEAEEVMTLTIRIGGGHHHGKWARAAGFSLKAAFKKIEKVVSSTFKKAKKCFQNEGSRRQQRIEQASVRKARWISGSRS